MKSFVNFVFALAVVPSVLADLHHSGFCIDVRDWVNIYNRDATIRACERYRNRNTGSEQWDTCPDCHITDHEVPHCWSDGKHIGGDELHYYCDQEGANDSLAD